MPWKLFPQKLSKDKSRSNLPSGFLTVDGLWLLKFCFWQLACSFRSYAVYAAMSHPPSCRCALLSQHKVAPRLELGLSRQCISDILWSRNAFHDGICGHYIDSLDTISPSYLQFQGLIDWVAREVPMGVV